MTYFKEKKYIEKIISDMPVALFVVDKDLIIRKWNALAEEITGLKMDDTIGKKFSEFSECNCMSGCRLFSGKEEDYFPGMECIVYGKNGEKIKIYKHQKPFYDENGDLLGGIETFEEILDLDADVDLFDEAYDKVIKHDLKSPLTSIIAFPDMMLEDDNLDESQKETLKFIKASGQKMLKQIEMTEILQKIKNDKFIYKPKEVNLVSILKDVIYIIEEVECLKYLDFHIHYNGDEIFTKDRKELYFFSDETVVFAIIYNLLKNAIYQLDRNDRVDIYLFKDETSMIMTVEYPTCIDEEIQNIYLDKEIHSQSLSREEFTSYNIVQLAKSLNADMIFNSSDEESSIVTVFGW